MAIHWTVWCSNGGCLVSRKVSKQLDNCLQKKFYVQNKIPIISPCIFLHSLIYRTTMFHSRSVCIHKLGPNIFEVQKIELISLISSRSSNNTKMCEGKSNFWRILLGWSKECAIHLNFKSCPVTLNSAGRHVLQLEFLHASPSYFSTLIAQHHILVFLCSRVLFYVLFGFHPVVLSVFICCLFFY